MRIGDRLPAVDLAKSDGEVGATDMVAGDRAALASRPMACPEVCARGLAVLARLDRR